MTEPLAGTIVSLARLRQRGFLPVVGVPVVELEGVAELAGRRVHVIDGGDPGPLLVLGWQGSEPSGSRHSPKLLRRSLSRTATRTLIVVYALLSDPQIHRTVITTDQVLTTVELLTGRSGHLWVIPALQDTLPRAGLTDTTAVGWGAGPTMRVWDKPTRDVMTHAATKLWQHPAWVGVAHAG